MKNFIKNILVLFTVYLLFIKRDMVAQNIFETILLWSKNIFPSVFPTIILSDYILSTTIINKISSSVGPLFSKLFKASKYSAYVFIMSLISGSPSNAKYIKDLLDKNIISKEEAIKILSFCNLYNPILILNLTSYLDTKDSISLLIINVISNIIVGLINRKQISISNNNYIKKQKFNLINSIKNSLDISFLILGVIITFSTINSLINFNHPLINGIIELTNGLNLMKDLPLKYSYKIIFTSILLSFSSLSIIIQIKSIFKDTNLNYELYYKSKIIHLIIMIVLTKIYIIIKT